MRKMERNLIEYKPGMKLTTNDIIHVSDECYIFVVNRGGAFTGRISMSTKGDWLSRYGLSIVSTGAYSYFDTIKNIINVLTSVIDASSGEVVTRDVKKGNVYGLKYGCIGIERTITNKDGEVRSVIITPFDGTHKWPRVTITIDNLRKMIDSVIEAYPTLDPSVYRSTAHGEALAMFERMGLVKLSKLQYKKVESVTMATNVDPTVEEMYLAVLNGRISLLDKEHMQSLSAVCGGEIAAQKIVINGSVRLNSLKLLSNARVTD